MESRSLGHQGTSRYFKMPNNANNNTPASASANTPTTNGSSSGANNGSSNNNNNTINNNNNRNSPHTDSKNFEGNIPEIGVVLGLKYEKLNKKATSFEVFLEKSPRT